MAFAEKSYIINGILYNMVESDEVQPKVPNESFTWTRSAIHLLLDEYLERKERFQSPLNLKKSLWNEIRKKFAEKDYIISEEQLDKKFRNLKKTYIKIYNNQRSTGGGALVTWEYYDKFNKIFNADKLNDSDDTLSNMAIGEDEKLSTQLLDMQSEDVPKAQLQVESIPGTSIKHERPMSKKSIPLNRKRTYTVMKKNVSHMNIEKEKLEEMRKSRIALEHMVKVQEDRNCLIKELIECLKENC
ncbi:uncharacterized protein LOC128893010 [Hylaeus anthracinus]|uniref:uncharacterized protein LOC128893010 n=1 Tax=Hylaeus anthracinus TaxID=313031 RepID=UPI0023B9798A|nr:uncharacterized protein LOC128893010 [Hylaeus anthracinus]XP_054009685.1 uncharacterized protein LOC128893010 [Hylaeus anthracinus]